MDKRVEAIHIEWDGPYALDEVYKLTGETDYGVYQIYATHPVYGADVLVYIGMAEKQCFGVRLKQESWWPYNQDANRVRIYCGRFAGEVTPLDGPWGKQIVLAERLLIAAHSPAFNAQRQIGKLDPDLQQVHLLNWGKHASLLPEVSGARYTRKLDSMSNYHVFNTSDPRLPSEL